jgi:hypothetical protein
MLVLICISHSFLIKNANENLAFAAPSLAKEVDQLLPVWAAQSAQLD